MLDCGWAIKWDVMTAVRRVQAFEEYGLTWIEEPLMEWDPEGYTNLRGKTTTLIAYGEKEWDLRGFEEVLATGTVDVVGIDPGRAEGITGFKKATERVEFYKRQSNAHAWSSAICSASSLAVSFSTPSAKLFEFKPLRNPMQHDLVDGAVRAHRRLGLPAHEARPGHRDHRGRGRATTTARRSSPTRSSTARWSEPGDGPEEHETMTWSIGAGLEGKGVIVTGATGGIGKAIVEAFATTGAKVLAVDLDQSKVDDVVSGLEGSGHIGMAANVGDFATHQRWSIARSPSSATSTASPTPPRCCAARAAWTR